MVLPPDLPPLDHGAFDAAALDASHLAPHLWDLVAAGSLTQTRPAHGERVLDACCGTGPSASAAAIAVGPNGAVDAVDVAEPMAAVAAQESSRANGGMPQLRVHVADVTTWSEGGYDLVQCVLGVFFFPGPARGIEHLVGRARPGGRVGITVWHRGALQSAGAALVSAVGEVRGQPVPTPSASALVQQIGEVDALREWLTDRGLVDVAITTVQLAFPAEPEPLWLLVLGSGFRGLLAGLAPEDVERVRTRYLLRLAGGPAVDATFLVGMGVRPVQTPVGGHCRRGAGWDFSPRRTPRVARWR